MATLLPRRAGYICQLCRTAQLPSSQVRLLGTLAGRHAKRRHVLSTSQATPERSRLTASSYAAAVVGNSRRLVASLPIKESKIYTENAAGPDRALQRIEEDVASIQAAESIPEELELLELLDRCHQLSNVIIFGRTEAPGIEETSGQTEATDSSILSDLEESTEKRSQSTSPESINLSITFRQRAAASLGEALYNLVKDSKIFISLPILQIYVRIQCLLGQPEYLPEIFFLYANKAIPRQNTSPIVYSKPWPRSPKYAIPQELSDAALECAIAQKDLPLALSMIDTTVATTAFRIGKLLRRATLPVAFVGATPVIAYAGAKWVSEWQDVWDPEMAKWTAVAGSIAYLGTLSTIGFVAITTYNDQMERVVWRPGTALRDRWLREEERAYFDRVALAWGFQKKWRRGEEQGEEWDALREVLGLRSMILDKTDLMEGMQ